MSNKEHNIMYYQSNFLTQKGSHDTENYCGYSINLVSTETPSAKPFETKTWWSQKVHI